MATKKNTQSQKRPTCPTCKKFLNNDVAALRAALIEAERQIALDAEQVKAAKDELAALRGTLQSTIEEWDKAKADILHWKEAYESKKQTCETLQDYDHWLVSRNLWERIVNKLEPGV